MRTTNSQFSREMEHQIEEFLDPKPFTHPAQGGVTGGRSINAGCLSNAFLEDLQVIYTFSFYELDLSLYRHTFILSLGISAKWPCIPQWNGAQFSLAIAAHMPELMW